MNRKKLITTVLAAGLALPVAVRAQNEEWRQKMEDAQEAKDDLMEAVSDKSGPKAAAASAKIARILQETKTFWAAQKMTDVARLADNSIAAVNNMAKIAASGQMDAAKAAYNKINATCSACHDVHPENRLKK